MLNRSSGSISGSSPAAGAASAPALQLFHHRAPRRGFLQQEEPRTRVWLTL